MLKHAMYGKDVAKELVDITYYFLRMNQVPTVINPMYDRNDGVWMQDCQGMSPDYFLYLYNKIGKNYEWFYANEWTRDHLKSYIFNHKFFVLEFYGDPIGMCAVKYDDEHTNIAYFGLVDHAVGAGHGLKFLNHCVHESWITNPKSVWLYTTSKDHPAALKTYQKAGFNIEKTETIQEYFPVKD